MNVRDPRLHAARPDLADLRLKGEVPAERYVAGRPARIVVPVADIRHTPRNDAGLDSQALLGDEILVFEEQGGWAWVQCVRDGYVGYVAEASIGEPGPAPTHRLSVPRSFVYPGPDMKLAATGVLGLGAAVTVAASAETRGTGYALLPSGEAVVASHLVPIGRSVADYVSVAEGLLGTPYLWGGVSGFGIDCSGLVQLSMLMAGRAVLRDTDMQAGTIGDAIDPGSNGSTLRRGDLVFWKGHVAIMADSRMIVHASGHTMLVCREPLKEAVERIAHLYGPPLAFRRPA